MTSAHRLPTGARKAVLWRVNGFASALALVVANVQSDRLSVTAQITAIDVVTDAQRTYYSRLQWFVLAQPTVYGHRELPERLTQRDRFSMADAVKKRDARQKNACGNEKSSPEHTTTHSPLYSIGPTESESSARISCTPRQKQK